MLVKVKYVGSSDEVEIAAAPGVRVKRRGVVEVPAGVADDLVAGGEFKRVAAKGDKDEVDDDVGVGESEAGDQPEGVEG